MLNREAEKEREKVREAEEAGLFDNDNTSSVHESDDCDSDSDWHLRELNRRKAESKSAHSSSTAKHGFGVKILKLSSKSKHLSRGPLKKQ